MNRVCSIFAQVLRLLPRIEFEQAVQKHRAEKHAKGFSCWTQLIAMLFCQLGQARSLREIIGGLASSEGKLKHLGVAKPPKRSTLAYANEHRSWELYQTVFEQVLAKCRGAMGGRTKFHFHNKLVSLDATSIDLCTSLFDWAQYKRTKGAVKLHLMLDHEGYLPCFAVMTDGKVHEIQIARQLSLQPGTILVVDRAYIDYLWMHRLTETSVFFVTRMRADIRYKVTRKRQTPRRGVVLRDEEILIRSVTHGVELKLRRIVIWNQEKQEKLVFLSNHMSFAASTIAAIYKDRWQIESFFKSMKQLLRVKTFVGTSANALKIQMWTALIAMLILKFLQWRASFGWSLSNLVALLRYQLFVYRDLYEWLDDPFQPPPALAPLEEQLLLTF
ncbi:MAG: IS4 family transposase [Bryobacteraceae bacterium]